MYVYVREKLHACRVDIHHIHIYVCVCTSICAKTPLVNCEHIPLIHFVRLHMQFCVHSILPTHIAPYKYMYVPK